MPENAVETRSLWKSWGRTAALRGIDLSVGRGEIFGLLGPNGAGKSTLIRILLGFLPRSSGSARVLGFDPSPDQLEVSRRAFGLVEDAGLYPGLSLRANAEVFLGLDGVRGKNLRAAADECVSRAGLSSSAGRLYRNCSAGMKQRLKLALGFARRVELFILDEPTTALDAAAAAGFKESVRGLNKSEGATFILSSHALLEMQALCTSAAVLKEGMVAAQGPIADLLGEAASVRVRCGDSAAAAAAASGLGLAASVLGPDSVEVAAREGDVPRLVNGLAKAGVSVRAVVPRVPTLEEKFFL